MGRWMTVLLLAAVVVGLSKLRALTAGGETA